MAPPTRGMRRVLSLARALSSQTDFFALPSLRQTSSSASSLARNSHVSVPQQDSWTQVLKRVLFARQGESNQESLWRGGAMGLLLGGAAAHQQVFAEKAENAVDAPDGAFQGEPLPSDKMEKVVQQVRAGLDERLVALKLLHPAGLPPLTVSAKGEHVSVKFALSPECEFSHLLADAVMRLGDGMFENKMVVSASDGALSRHFTISPQDFRSQGVWMVLLLGKPFLDEDGTSEVQFLKRGYLATKELDAIVSSFTIANGLDPKDRRRRKVPSKEPDVPSKERGVPSTEPSTRDRSPKSKALQGLEDMGVKIYGLENNKDASTETSSDRISWDTIAGYHEQKREIEDMVLLAFKQPEVFDNIARGTRRKFESNRPRAILFEGPPGTGKTSCARVIASQAGVPLLYVPLEAVMSKYYGQSERLLANVFKAGNELSEGAIVFLDELDSFATSRDNEMHEATRRMLSVLLRQMDGFEQDKKVVVIAATNRKQDLDPALLSRFDTSVAFNLPDESTREEIASQYARHLSSSELKSLAAVSDGMSGRDIHDLCQHAERRWASKVIRGSLAGDDRPAEGLPPINEYLDCAVQRRQTIVRYGQGDGEYLRVGDHRPVETRVEGEVFV